MDERFKEAINKWAKAKGINPERVLAALDIPKARQAPLSEIVKGPINTSIFEEAEVIEL
jgi:hypothetical protein